MDAPPEIYESDYWTELSGPIFQHGSTCVQPRGSFGQLVIDLAVINHLKCFSVWCLLVSISVRFLWDFWEIFTGPKWEVRIIFCSIFCAVRLYRPLGWDTHPSYLPLPPSPITHYQLTILPTDYLYTGIRSLMYIYVPSLPPATFIIKLKHLSSSLFEEKLLFKSFHI